MIARRQSERRGTVVCRMPESTHEPIRPRASSSPVFLFGVDHSGTTVVYRMLAYHPDLAWFSQFTFKDMASVNLNWGPPFSATISTPSSLNSTVMTDPGGRPIFSAASFG